MIWQRVGALMREVLKFLDVPRVIMRLRFRNIRQQKVRIVMPLVC